MKKVLMAVVVVLAGVSLTSLSYAVIAGSGHDLSAVTNGETCIACHTPHNADITTVEAPLWNHKLTTATYTAYDTPTITAAMGAPTGISKLCLSCHDGTVAPNAYGGAAGTGTIAAAGNLGVNMKKNHPVSFTYNTALADLDGELVDPATSTDITAWVKGEKFECSSCHDVHNNTGFTAMLHKENTASALCLTCHSK